jgi:hypothetical protein
MDSTPWLDSAIGLSPGTGLASPKPMQTWHAAVLTVCCALAALAFGACDVEAGAPAPTCVFGGKTYNQGDSFHDLDSCNQCRCNAQGVACTAMGCPMRPVDDTDGAAPPAPGTCNYAGRTYNLGDSFAATDGCHWCDCTEYGVLCSFKDCRFVPSYLRIPTNDELSAIAMPCEPMFENGHVFRVTATGGCTAACEPICGTVRLRLSFSESLRLPS